MRSAPLLLAATLVATALPGPTSARADPFRFEERVEAGRPEGALRVGLRADEEEGPATVWARGTAGPAAESPLPLPGRPGRVTVEVIRLAGGASVALLRAESGGGRAAALLSARRGRARVIWTGRLDPHGDLGERRADAIEATDRTGDGLPDLIVGITHESTRICGQERTLLVPRAVDPATLDLRPVVLRRLPEGEEEVQVTASPEGPGPAVAPLLNDALVFDAASTSSGSPTEPGLVPAPRALADGRPETFWAEAWGGAGRWEFASARWTGGAQRMRAFALILSPPDPALAARLARPAELWLVGDAGPRIHVTIPPGVDPSAPLWITPPTPLSWRCLSVVLGDATAGGVGAPTGLTEVAVYTDLDFGEGIQPLLEELVADGDAGSQAARLLGRLGAQGLSAVIEAWPTLTPTGRRRAVRVLASNADTSPEARSALAHAAADADPEVRADALSALVQTGAEAAGALATLVREPGEAGDEAALALAFVDPAAGVEAVLAALVEPAGSERATLRRALREALRRGGGEARARLSRWSEEEQPVAAAAAVALALAPQADTAELAASLLGGAAPRATRFEDRWRLVQAAADLPSEPDTDRWLVELAGEAEEWMLRAEAVHSLARRRAPSARERALAALADPYPRVRVAAIAALGDDDASARAVAQSARSDRWPMVRAAAITALADVEGAADLIRRAVRDRSKAVRAAAVATLTRREDRQAWPLVAARLADDDEWPEVIEAGVGYARALCVPELADALVIVLRRGLRPDAWAPDVELGVLAVDTLGRVGGEEAASLLRRIAEQPGAAALRAAAQRALRHPGRCAPGDGP